MGGGRPEAAQAATRQEWRRPERALSRGFLEGGTGPAWWWIGGGRWEGGKGKRMVNGGEVEKRVEVEVEMEMEMEMKMKMVMVMVIRSRSTCEDEDEDEENQDIR